jgi:DNA polymerase-3 subunit beta
MKLKIERDRLLRPLGHVSGVVEKRQTLPILGNVYVKLEQNVLTLIGTDLETEVLTRVGNVEGENGECTVTARKFYDICRMLPEEAVINLVNEGDRTIITSGRSRFNLQSLPASDFPRLEAEKWEESLTIKQNELKNLLEKTAFSMAQQDVRYYLNGCLLEIDKNGMKVVATDGHRLAKSVLSTPLEIESMRQVIIPRKAVAELLRFLVDGDDSARLDINPNHMRVSTETWVFVAKLIDGRFPDYEKVIPPSLSTHLEVDRLQLIEMLARTAILTNEKFRGVRLVLKPGVMKVMANNPEQEEAVDEMVVDFDGEEVEIGFNVGYLMEALRAIESDTVDLGLQDANSSCTIIKPGNPSPLYLVMPMRI